jgi:hypothetical protein
MELSPSSSHALPIDTFIGAEEMEGAYGVCDGRFACFERQGLELWYNATTALH